MAAGGPLGAAAGFVGGFLRQTLMDALIIKYKNMRKLSLKETEKISGGTNGALCFAAGIGILTIGGPLTAVGLASAAYAVKCWNS